MMRDCWITNEKQLQAVIRQERLKPILIRCHEGRMTAPAQDVPGIVKALQGAGWGIRDLSFGVEVAAAETASFNPCEVCGSPTGTDHLRRVPPTEDAPFTCPRCRGPVARFTPGKSPAHAMAGRREY